jgi:hypothetical protein
MLASSSTYYYIYFVITYANMTSVPHFNAFNKSDINVTS